MRGNPPPAVAAFAPPEEFATWLGAGGEHAEMAAPATGAFETPLLLELIGPRLPIHQRLLLWMSDSFTGLREVAIAGRANSSGPAPVWT
jgi:hypothetical protein